MRARDLIRLRARTLAGVHGFTDFHHLKGHRRIAYRYLLHALRLLSDYAKTQKESAPVRG